MVEIGPRGEPGATSVPEHRAGGLPGDGPAARGLSAAGNLCGPPAPTALGGGAPKATGATGGGDAGPVGVPGPRSRCGAAAPLSPRRAALDASMRSVGATQWRRWGGRQRSNGSAGAGPAASSSRVGGSGGGRAAAVAVGGVPARDGAVTWGPPPGARAGEKHVVERGARGGASRGRNRCLGPPRSGPDNPAGTAPCAPGVPAASSRCP